jgi:hypothetical protein
MPVAYIPNVLARTVEHIACIWVHRAIVLRFGAGTIAVAL